MTKKIAAALAVVGLAGLGGCGTITQGTTQVITVTSSPPGGHCDFVRKGDTLGSVDTPGTIKVNKTKHDIMMNCKLAGYHDANVNLESGYGAGTFGNIILGGVIGWGIDSATGADNKYPSTADVKFVPMSEPAPAPATQPVDPAKPGA